jgi:hypothetical protein
MKTQLTILALVALAFPAFAQNRVLSTTTNGTVVSGRTNPLTLSNPLAWNNSTNAATTISNLFASNSLPSGAAAAGAVWQADGAGGSVAVASRVQYSRWSSNTVRSSWTNANFFDPFNNDTNASLSLLANSLYRIEFGVETLVSSNVTGYGMTIASSGNASSAAYNAGSMVNTAGNVVGLRWSSSGSTAAGTSSGSATLLTSSVNYTFGGFLFVRTGTNAITVNVRWWPTNNNTNSITFTTNSWLRAEKLD